MQTNLRDLRGIPVHLPFDLFCRKNLGWVAPTKTESLWIIQILLGELMGTVCWNQPDQPQTHCFGMLWGSPYVGIPHLKKHDFYQPGRKQTSMAHSYQPPRTLKQGMVK